MRKQREKLPFLMTMIQGAVGKKFVIKHYWCGIIKTKYPDMTRIKALASQRKCRNIFTEAVAYAKTVIADKKLKDAWQKRLKRRNGVYNEAVKYYMLKISREKKGKRSLQISS